MLWCTKEIGRFAGFHPPFLLLLRWRVFFKKSRFSSKSYKSAVEIRVVMVTQIHDGNCGGVGLSNQTNLRSTKISGDASGIPII